MLSDSAALGGGLIGLGNGGNDHNARKCKATFKVPRRGVVHGLAGYFESVLYGDVELSTRPDTIDTKSKDMISWFPIFFPLKVRKAYFYPFCGICPLSCQGHGQSLLLVPDSGSSWSVNKR